jgi:NADH:ubiquinone oxidoreductase subunit C
MSEEEKIAQELTQKFNFPVKVNRVRRISAEVPMEKFWDVFDHAVKSLDFSMLSTITGLDEGDKYGLIYHLCRESGIMLMIKTSIPKNDPVIKTVIKYFPSAEIYEREIFDLLGINIQVLPEGNRYPLPDDWPADNYPLRKDWKTEMLDKKETC